MFKESRYKKGAGTVEIMQFIPLFIALAEVKHIVHIEPSAHLLKSALEKVFLKFLNKKKLN